MKRGGGKARGSHWVGSRRHRRLCGRIEKRERKHPPRVVEFGVCVKCGTKFVPEWCDKIGRFSQVCDPCLVATLLAIIDGN